MSYSRLARRGGVKRISATIYDEARGALKSWLEAVSLSLYDHYPPLLYYA